MAINEDLLDLLICPKCKAGVAVGPAGITLDCKTCGLSFPVKDDIPVMLVEEAQPLDGSSQG